MDAAKLQEYKVHYHLLKPFPVYPGEWSWLNRIDHWPDFVERGQEVADVMARLFADAVADKGQEEGARAYHFDFRWECPPLHDLLMAAYGKAHVVAAFKGRKPWPKRKR